MKVDVYDEEGNSIRGEKGELVCTAPFPSMPVGFWNDPDGSRYHAAYFEKFPGVWSHGDYVELTAHDGLIIHGRSDAVLNPGGVRIGTAEIYRQAEQLDEVVEALVVSQDWPPEKPTDVRIVLFVRLREGAKLDDGLVEKIKRRIRENTTPRHVPAKVVQVTDIPRTKSGKIVELAVRNVVPRAPGKKSGKRSPIPRRSHNSKTGRNFLFEGVIRFSSLVSRSSSLLERRFLTARPLSVLMPASTDG
jgi:acetoacetyl-CoA synthetase